MILLTSRSSGRYALGIALEGALKQCIAYKAEATGVRLVLVNPAYTSQTCPYCRYLGDRKGIHFSCSCGFVGDADKVGAFNIAAQGAKSNALKSPAA